MKLNLFLFSLLPFAASAFAGEPATNYNESSQILSIPRVDTEAKLSRYRDARLQLAKDGRFDLIDVREMREAYVGGVEVILHAARPTQVLLKVAGDLPTPCNALTNPAVRRIDNHFEVVL